MFDLDEGFWERGECRVKQIVARTYAALFILMLAGCDHATKHLARTQLVDQAPLVLIHNVLDLRFTENPGLSFSLFHDLRPNIQWPLLLLLNALASIVCLILWYRMKVKDRWTHLAFALIIGGAFGNFADRFLHGRVVDFIYLHRWPIFNAADIFIAVGVGLLMLRQWRRVSA
jgi:signal peptidase II